MMETNGMSMRDFYYHQVKQEYQRRLSKADPLIILSIIEVESSYNPWQFRFEPEFKDTKIDASLCKKLVITENSEKIAQETSWGLGQVMGSSARAFGFKDLLTKLCIPQIGIQWTFEVFERQCMLRYPHQEDAICAYNCGTVRFKDDGSRIDQEYVDKVMKVYSEVKSLA